MIRNYIRAVIRKMCAATHPELRILTGAEYRTLKLAEARLSVAVSLLDRSFGVDLPMALSDRYAYRSIATQDHFRAMHQFVETCKEEGHGRNRRY